MMISRVCSIWIHFTHPSSLYNVINGFNSIRLDVDSRVTKGARRPINRRAQAWRER